MEEERSVPLPCECISQIASYLEYPDRANMEMVSRMWRLGSLDSHWRTRVLNLHDTSVWGEGAPIKMTRKKVEWMLKRFGSNLDTLLLNGIRLKFHTNFLMDDLLIETIAEHCQNLTTLELAGSFMTNKNILHIGTQITQLEHLDISACTDIRGKFALDPLANLTKLEWLIMPRLHPDVGARFLKSLSNLRYLDCRDNHGVTDDDICNLFSHVHSLHTVIVQGCINITEIVVDTILELKKNLCSIRQNHLQLYVYGTRVLCRKIDKKYYHDYNLYIHYGFVYLNSEEGEDLDYWKY